MEIPRNVIAGIAALLLEYPSIAVLLEGHTDSRASAAYNLELSRRRVQAVREAFLDMGVDPARIATTYRGKEAPTAAETSERGFALNRRVEMIFVDSEGREIKATAQEDDLQLEGERRR